jgi:hypothetical protein
MADLTSKKSSAPRLKGWAIASFPLSFIVGGALGIKFGNILIGLLIGAGMGVGLCITLMVAYGVWSSFGETPNN